MSDMQKWLKKKSSSPEIKKVEAGERSEGVRDAIKAGRGDVVTGARKMRMKKEGLSTQLAKQKKMCAKGK